MYSRYDCSSRPKEEVLNRPKGVIISEPLLGCGQSYHNRMHIPHKHSFVKSFIASTQLEKGKEQILSDKLLALSVVDTVGSINKNPVVKWI